MKKRIAVIYLGRKGAGPVYSFEMAKGLVENGYEVYAFISSQVENKDKWTNLNTAELEVIDTFSGNIEYVKSSIRFRLIDYPKLKQKYRNIIFDACYIPMGHFWDDYIVNALGNPVKIYTDHDPVWHSSDKTIRNRVLRMGAKLLNIGIHRKHPDHVVVLSETFRIMAKEKYGISGNQIHVIPHGIFDFYKTVDNGTKHCYDKDKVNFLFWGRIEGYKGIDDLAKAYKMLKQKHDNVSLTVVGSGDFSPYKELYCELDDVEIVNKWIPDEEVASFFKTDAKLFLVLPYKDATQSGVIPTAMSFSIPVIVSNTGGLTEQVTDGVTGFVCEPNNPMSLFECMEKVMYIETDEVVENALKYITSLDWKSLSSRIGDMI